MSEFLAGRVGPFGADCAEAAEVRRGLGLGVALAALVLMALPAAIGLLVLVGALT